MSQSASDPRFASRAPPKRGMRLSWSDPAFRAVIWQIVIVGAVAGVVWQLIINTRRNLAARHIATGFDFLWSSSPIPIGESLIPYEPAVNTYGYALMVGVLNTLVVAVAGIVLATVIGTVIGIGRLSANWLIARLCAAYVELLRDTPLLLQLLAWYALLSNLPPVRGAFRIGDWIALSNRGLSAAALVWQPAHSWALAAFCAGLLGTAVWARRCRLRQEATGERAPLWPAAVLLLVVLPLAVWAAMGAPFAWEKPALQGRNFVGGVKLTPEFAALLIGLSTYTAAYIAEIVRTGIQAVPIGQWEAAGALGLRRGVVLRRIVLPQALRVIIPPLTSQYLNITKNSTLAIAIGYPDMVAIASTTLNQTGQAPEGIGVIMALFLTISLSISLLMNWHNARIAFKER